MPRPARAVIGLCAVLAACAGPSSGAPNPDPPAAEPVPIAAPSAPNVPPATPGVLPTPIPVRPLPPEPGTLALKAHSCDGGVVLEWSPSADPAFHHYTGLRSPESDISPVYPPISPAVDWGGAYATDRFVVSAVDSGLLASDKAWHYRLVSYDADGRVLESSAVETATVRPVASLGELTVEGVRGRTTRIAWTPYSGLAACFTEYRVLYGTVSPPATLLATVSGRRSTSLDTDVLRADTTYVLRVDAVRATPLGSFVVARSEVATFTP